MGIGEAAIDKRLEEVLARTADEGLGREHQLYMAVILLIQDNILLEQNLLQLAQQFQTSQEDNRVLDDELRYWKGRGLAAEIVADETELFLDTNHDRIRNALEEWYITKDVEY